MTIKKDTLFIIAITGLLCFTIGLLLGAVVFQGSPQDRNMGQVGMTGEENPQGQSTGLQGRMTSDARMVDSWAVMTMINYHYYNIYWDFYSDNTLELNSGQGVLNEMYWHGMVIGDNFTVYCDGNNITNAYGIWISDNNFELDPNSTPDYVEVGRDVYTVAKRDGNTYTLKRDGSVYKF